MGALLSNSRWLRNVTRACNLDWTAKELGVCSIRPGRARWDRLRSKLLAGAFHSSVVNSSESAAADEPNAEGGARTVRRVRARLANLGSSMATNVQGSLAATNILLNIPGYPGKSRFNG